MLQILFNDTFSLLQYIVLGTRKKGLFLTRISLYKSHFELIS